MLKAWSPFSSLQSHTEETLQRIKGCFVDGTFIIEFHCSQQVLGEYMDSCHFQGCHSSFRDELSDLRKPKTADFRHHLI